ncbi:MAG: hypothetical protein IJR92_04180, partial [Alphaproteobacteria bacterium]|nr:hypothetical protein [Alphaproteobacteria bacterium]
ISIMFDPTVSCPANSYYVGNSQGEVGNYQCICNNGYVAVRNRTACEQCPDGLTLNSLTYDASTDANRYYTNCSGCTTTGQSWNRANNSCSFTYIPLNPSFGSAEESTTELSSEVNRTDISNNTSRLN